MNLNEALAVWLYTKDNVDAWAEPAKSAKTEAWETICKHAKDAIQRRHAEPR